MENYIFWTFMLGILAVISVGAAVFLRAYLTGTAPSAILFRPKGERRLEVVDHTSVDNRRKLILIRRDDVEHLIMTGGPVDVVIETGIKSQGALGHPTAEGSSEAAAAPPPIRRAPFFGRSSDAANPAADDPKF
ncbi:flagellar biosynthetic protein FliO [Hyphomicrobium sp. 2TAF46]|uniref:flagellar biosynthetic protein FliO n=1 Tax=Hyphomicrobium sp. 2TAF46 TaxID=3233019 RepID=UPI003F8E990C